MIRRKSESVISKINHPENGSKENALIKNRSVKRYSIQDTNFGLGKNNKMSVLQKIYMKSQITKENFSKSKLNVKKHHDQTLKNKRIKTDNISVPAKKEAEKIRKKSQANIKDELLLVDKNSFNNQKEIIHKILNKDKGSIKVKDKSKFSKKSSKSKINKIDMQKQWNKKSFSRQSQGKKTKNYKKLSQNKELIKLHTENLIQDQHKLTYRNAQAIKSNQLSLLLSQNNQNDDLAKSSKTRQYDSKQKEMLSFVDLYKNFKKNFNFTYSKINKDSGLSLTKNNSSSLSKSKDQQHKEINKLQNFKRKLVSQESQQIQCLKKPSMKQKQKSDVNNQPSFKMKFNKSIQIANPIKPHFSQQQTSDNPNIKESQKQFQIIQNQNLNIIEFQLYEDPQSSQNSSNSRQFHDKRMILQDLESKMKDKETLASSLQQIQKSKTNDFICKSNLKFENQATYFSKGRIKQIQQFSPIIKEREDYLIRLQPQQVIQIDL